ncbi:MAG: homoserine kinase, partial [Gemmatimonadaceae bacterium]
MTVLLSAAVRVPASTANLGSGFDCVGVAVNRWLSASVSVVPVQGKAPRLTIERAGTLSALDVAPELDLLYAGFVAAYRESDGDEGAGCARHDLSFSATSEIPIARGLGSSAAALVAGAALANRTLDLGLTAGQIIRACSLAEGHPDNVVAAVHGGAV